MFTEHPSFLFPRDKTTKIWRYLDFPKFVSVLEASALFFCRMDRLGDPFESSAPQGLIGKLEAEAVRHASLGTEEGNQIAATLRHNIHFFGWTASVASLTCYANCWHINQHESDSMWKKYLERDQGVALISTSHRLATSFPEKSPEILIGRVSYVDYKKADFLNSDGTFNVLNFVTKKRHAFKDERELRAVIWLRNRDGELLTNNPTGIVVTVELNRLLRGIVVSPGSPGWFYNLVVSLTKRYGIKVPVSRSALAESPVR